VAAFGLALALVSSAAAQPIGASSSAGIEAADPAAAPGTNATPGIATLHAFLGAGDGFDPLGGLAADSLGNLYGTTYYDGRGPYLGTVFMLQRPTTAGGKWVYRVIYRFSPSYSDGNGPAGNLTVKDGIVYGTTHAGANPSCGCGEVFRLRPLNRAKTTWKYAIIHRFNTQNTGTTPEAGVTFGPDGALYGTTSGGGTHGAGTIFKLTGSGDGPWSFKPLRSLAGASGSGPSAELLAGKDGTLYGTTFGGGKYNRGSIFSLSKSGAFKVLYDFKGVDQPLGPKDGAEPEARLAFAPDGAIYGTTEFGGQSDEGTIFRLTKGAGGAWAYKIVHDFGQDGKRSTAR